MEIYVYGRLAHGNHAKREISRKLDSWMVSKAITTATFLEILKKVGLAIVGISAILESGLQLTESHVSSP